MIQQERLGIVPRDPLIRFSKSFREIYGIKPSEYKQNLGNFSKKCELYAKAGQ